MENHDGLEELPVSVVPPHQPPRGEDKINFPAPGGCMSDSGEGGMFVMMVVPEPKGLDLGHACHVDVHILLTQPDVCVSRERNEVWEAYDSDAWRTEMELSQFIQKQGKLEWKRWMFHAHSGDRLSDSVQAAIHLGSTSYSLYDEHQGAYWTATKDDLTLVGKTLYNALEEAYGVTPLILTFLDT